MAKEVVVIGKENLQNSLLASYIETHTTYPTTVTEPESFISVNPDEIQDGTLLLIDCNSWTEERIISFLENLPDKAESTHIALFNVSESCDTENFAQHTAIKGLFPENIAHEQFISGIKSIFDGELWLSRKLLSKLLINTRKNTPARIEDFGLTRRETEIIKLIAEGSRNNDIANSLCLSEHTVKTHIYHIYKKINVDNRMQAANWANRHLRH